MDELVSDVTGRFGFGNSCFLQMHQIRLGLIHSGLDTAAQIGCTFTDFVGGHAQQFFGISNDNPQVTCQFVFLICCNFCHGRPPSC